MLVSVPLRGKEGAGLRRFHYNNCNRRKFPSPCGVRRVRDGPSDHAHEKCWVGFPSPCGVRRVRDWRFLGFCDARPFPSPCGVRRVRDAAKAVELAQEQAELFPSPCGVRRVRDTTKIT